MQLCLRNVYGSGPIVVLMPAGPVRPGSERLRHTARSGATLDPNRLVGLTMVTPATDVTRQRILDAAEVLLAEQGLHALTVREVTRAAGVNVAMVNYVFGSKDELLIGLGERMFAPMTRERLRRFAALLEAGSYDVDDAVLALVQPLVRMREKHGAAAIELHRHLAAHPEGRVRTASWDQLTPAIAPFTELLTRLQPPIDRLTLDARVHLVCQFASSVVLAPLDAAALGAPSIEVPMMVDFLVGALQGPRTR